MTKKRVLLISFLFSFLLGCLWFFQQNCNYNAQGFCWSYWDSISEIGRTIFIFFPIFIFSCITYRMNDEVFRSWSRFTLVFVTVFLLALVISSDNNGSSGWLISTPSTREIVFLLGLGTYVSISLFQVVTKPFFLRSKKIEEQVAKDSTVKKEELLTRKQTFFFSFFVILTCFPIIYLVYETSLLVSGSESAGVRITELHLSWGFIQSYFGEYLVRVTISLLSVFFFGFFYFGGATFFIPLILDAVISVLVTTIIFKRWSPIKAKKFLKGFLWVLVGMYILLIVGYATAVLTKNHSHTTKENDFNKKYTFTTLNLPTRFVYFDWIAKDGFYINMNLTVSNFDGSGKQVLSQIIRSPKDWETPQFPSPRGTYYLLINNDYASPGGHVQGTNGSNVFDIPDTFYGYRNGVVQWSEDERYLAVYSEKISYPQTAGHLKVYDIKLKKTVGLLEGVPNSAFVWGENNTLYHTCGEHICRSTFSDKSSSTEQLAGTINCSPLVLLEGKLYCSIADYELERITSDKLENPDTSFAGTDGLGSRGHIISQDISGKSSSTTISVITKVPLYFTQRLSVLDKEHLLVYSEAGIFKIAAIDIRSGRLMDLGGVQNVFTPLIEHTNITDMPVVYK